MSGVPIAGDRAWDVPILPGPTYILRHAETVYNAAGRLQGRAVDTPLTTRGFLQAQAMGTALARIIAPDQKLRIVTSPMGRTLQTLAILCDALELDWFTAKRDARLAELSVGASIESESFADNPAVHFDPASRMLLPAADGESYVALGARLSAWIAEERAAGDATPRLVVTHGLASQVLRGLLTGLPPWPELGVPAAAHLPQGSIVRIDQGHETVIFTPPAEG